MKVSKLLQHTIWKSSWFIFGLVAIGFGLWGILFSPSTKVPPLESLRIINGIVKKVEVWSSRYGGSIHVLYLSINGKEKHFNANRCEDDLELISPTDVVTVYADKSFGLVDGSIWQIIKSGITLCAYDEVVNRQERSGKFQVKFGVVALILGLLMTAIGFYRNKAITPAYKAEGKK